MILKIVKLSVIVIVLLSSYPLTTFAQESSAPQTKISSKGLAFVNLSTYPANPVTGQLTVILIKFSDPQTKTPLVDLRYNFIIIRNQTGPVFTMRQATTITGEAGIPFQFEKPGDYQVEIDINSTASQTTSHLDEVTFPLYVAQREAQVTNQTANVMPKNIPTVNIKSDSDTTHVLIDGILLAVGVSIAFFIIRKLSRDRKHRMA